MLIPVNVKQLNSRQLKANHVELLSYWPVNLSFVSRYLYNFWWIFAGRSTESLIVLLAVKFPCFHDRMFNNDFLLQGHPYTVLDFLLQAHICH